MGTDAPIEMGFTVTLMNTMHINLEPVARVETKRLFKALSNGGAITMELKDIHLGDEYFAYYGSCTDKYGVNWMFNCLNK